MDMGSHCQSNISTSGQLGLYKKPGIFLNDPKSRYLFFTLIVFSGGELPVDNKCEFSSLLWVRASLVESQQMPSFVCILHSFPFMFDHFCINFLSFCFHVLSCSVAMYQRYRSSKADMFKPSGGYPPKRSRFLIYRYRFCYCLAILLEACAGCHLQAS